MKRVLLLLAPLALTGPAVAADMSFGVGLAASTDLPDKVSGDYAKFGVGPGLHLPFRVDLAPFARLRVSARIDSGFGSNRVTWRQYVDGEEVRFYDDDHWSMLLAGALTAGGEFMPPVELPVMPYLGVGFGAAWVGTYHSFGGATQHLLDEDANDLDSSSNIDPYTTQFTFISDIDLGAELDLSEALALWFELGYSIAFVSEKELKKTPAVYDALRSPYGWNAARLGVGVSFAL